MSFHVFYRIILEESEWQNHFFNVDFMSAFYLPFLLNTEHNLTLLVEIWKLGVDTVQSAIYGGSTTSSHPPSGSA